jgi:hypothetical protein
MQGEVGVKARGQFFTIDFRTQEHGRSDVMQLRASIRRFIVLRAMVFLHCCAATIARQTKLNLLLFKW